MGILLRRLGYRYIKGESRHFFPDSVHNVTYRATYLQHKVQNRDRNNNPIHPEVYLDESYVNTNHVRCTTRFVEESFENWVANRKGSGGHYHRNFDAALFELWFTDLSQELSI
ncbi:hypothetical protein PHMEG_00018477 [Phytophthora megakarya]|uniref:Uncharacterized protein n=1 Tax=Phytophthora megakarya TaxID=4795 RepID=A0A225VV96_9STRA|nr:hypothetical protein PHMEG_00018477 [Phytophthora megakarya]